MFKIQHFLCYMMSPHHPALAFVATPPHTHTHNIAIITN